MPEFWHYSYLNSLCVQAVKALASLHRCALAACNEIIRMHRELEGGIEKLALRITDWHKVITRDRFFYPTLTRLMDFFLAHHLILHFI